MSEKSVAFKLGHSLGEHKMIRRECNDTMKQRVWGLCCRLVSIHRIVERTCEQREVQCKDEAVSCSIFEG